MILVEDNLIPSLLQFGFSADEISTIVLRYDNMHENYLLNVMPLFGFTLPDVAFPIQTFFLFGFCTCKPFKVIHLSNGIRLPTIRILSDGF